VSGRPYAKVAGSEPSVTTIIQASTGKPFLAPSAAKITAEFALADRKWRTMSADEAVRRMKGHYRQVWAAKAALGTAVHTVNEAWCAGDSTDVAETELAPGLAPLLAGLDQFWSLYEPETVATETVVRTPGLYVGSLDWLARIDGRLWLIDLKTTSKELGRAIYASTWTLQLAAYGFAAETVTYTMDTDDNVLGSEAGPPIPTPERFGVLHLHTSGDWELLGLPDVPAARPYFVDMARCYAWRKALDTKARKALQ